MKGVIRKYDKEYKIRNDNEKGNKFYTIWLLEGGGEWGTNDRVRSRGNIFRK